MSKLFAFVTNSLFDQVRFWIPTGYSLQPTGNEKVMSPVVMLVSCSCSSLQVEHSMLTQTNFLPSFWNQTLWNFRVGYGSRDLVQIYKRGSYKNIAKVWIPELYNKSRNNNHDIALVRGRPVLVDRKNWIPSVSSYNEQVLLGFVPEYEITQNRRSKCRPVSNGLLRWSRLVCPIPITRKNFRIGSLWVLG